MHFCQKLTVAAIVYQHSIMTPGYMFRGTFCTVLVNNGGFFTNFKMKTLNADFFSVNYLLDPLQEKICLKRFCPFNWPKTVLSLFLNLFYRA